MNKKKIQMNEQRYRIGSTEVVFVAEEVPMGTSCEGCVFSTRGKNERQRIFGSDITSIHRCDIYACSPLERDDRRNVIFRIKTEKL